MPEISLKKHILTNRRTITMVTEIYQKMNGMADYSQEEFDAYNWLGEGAGAGGNWLTGLTQGSKATYSYPVYHADTKNAAVHLAEFANPDGTSVLSLRDEWDYDAAGEISERFAHFQ